jgi:GT2 family glycosyltransferase
MSLSVDVVIPVHGQWELTERCLATLATRDACIRRVIVVDDKSPDDSAARLRARSDIMPLILENNVGFARACNAGARAGDADAIFFLNNDTLVPAGTIARLAATLEDSGAAAIGPKLLHGDGTLQVAGLAMLANQTHFERLFVYLDADLPQAQIAYEPIALSGAAVLVRRTAFDAIGAFEEAFLNGSEDVDLCLKLWAAGYRCRYEPRATIVHLEGASRGAALSRTARAAARPALAVGNAVGNCGKTHVPRGARATRGGASGGKSTRRCAHRRHARPPPAARNRAPRTPNGRRCRLVRAGKCARGTRR